MNFLPLPFSFHGRYIIKTTNKEEEEEEVLATLYYFSRAATERSKRNVVAQVAKKEGESRMNCPPSGQRSMGTMEIPYEYVHLRAKRKKYFECFYECLER